MTAIENDSPWSYGTFTLDVTEDKTREVEFRRAEGRNTGIKEKRVIPDPEGMSIEEFKAELDEAYKGLADATIDSKVTLGEIDGEVFGAAFQIVTGWREAITTDEALALETIPFTPAEETTEAA